jgi:AbrB family looped-hinge helix DNA binding protein
MQTTISSKGQITVPRAIREKLGLVAGTKIELEPGPEGTFIGRKTAQESFFARFKGIGRRARVPYRDSAAALDALRGPVGQGDVD